MEPFTTFSTFCHKQIFISLGILFIEWASTYAANIYVNNTAQTLKFSIIDFFSKWDQWDQLVIFTEESFNGKLHFLCSVIHPFVNLVGLWILRNNESSSFSKHLTRFNPIFPTSKFFPLSANPFRMSTAKAVTNTPQSKPIGYISTLVRLYPKTLALKWARSLICFINPADKNWCENES